MPVILLVLLGIVIAFLGNCAYDKVQDYNYPERVVERERLQTIKDAEQAQKDEQERTSRRERIQKQLPPGCTFRDFGNYQREERGTNFAIFAIFCPNQQVTTKTDYEVKRQSGKQTVTDHYNQSVTTGQP